ncbi:MAG: hypothetical protein ABIJ61_13115 [bacterium]
MTIQNKQSSTALKNIPALIEDHKFVEAIPQIENARSRPGSDLSKIDAARLYYFWSICLYEIGQYRLAIIKAKVAQFLCRELTDHKLYADIKVSYGYSLFQLGRMKQSLEEFNEAYASYRRAGDSASLLYPLNRMSHIHYLKGDLRRCQEMLQECVENARQYHSTPQVLIDTRNMIRVLMATGEFGEVSKALDSISDLLSEPKDYYYSEFLAGLRHTQIGEYEAATSTIDSARVGFESLSRERDIVVCLE